MLLAPSSKSSLAKLSRLLPGRRLLLILWPFLVIAVIFVVLIAQSLAILSAGRAFVEGESLWSKAQKSSVMHLVRYVHSHDEADYRQFQQALKVPLGDRKARLELEKPNPDLAVAYQGFLEGRNHPDDIPGLITLFRRLRNVSYIDRCITLWTDADRSIDELIAVADTLHRRVLAGETDPSTVNSMLASIFEVDAQLTSQSDAFSASLGEATRVAILILSIATLVLAGTLIPIALMLRAECSCAAMRSHGRA